MTKLQRDAAAYYRKISAECIHYLSIDCVVFGFHDNQLKVLLLRWKGTNERSLPGGFIRKDESIDDAAIRCLQERTGLKKIFLQHFDNFGDVNRYDQKKTWKRTGLDLPKIKWSERTISIGYLALVEYSHVHPSPDFLTEACEWVSLGDIPPLLFDHNRIIDVALDSLRRHLPYLPIRHLLPSAFTLPELQKLYETILDRKLDTRNFQKKILASGILRKLDIKRERTPYRAPFLYKFDNSLYAATLRQGDLMFR